MPEEWVPMAKPLSVLLQPEETGLQYPIKATSVASGAEHKIKQVNQRHRKYAELRADGMPIKAAARAAGFKMGTPGTHLEKDGRIQSLIAKHQAETAEALKLTRQHVLSGFLEAIDIGRLQADPHAMVKGWTEIGKMCGYYAPEVKNINMSISAKRMIDKFETMSDEELLQLAEKTVDGSFTREDPALTLTQESPRGSGAQGEEA